MFWFLVSLIVVAAVAAVAVFPPFLKLLIVVIISPFAGFLKARQVKEKKPHLATLYIVLNIFILLVFASIILLLTIIE